jgi:4-amino-4-deoxy-L-arabinose transferase-like glycosyltransferase
MCRPLWKPFLERCAVHFVLLSTKMLYHSRVYFRQAYSMNLSPTGGANTGSRYAMPWAILGAATAAHLALLLYDFLDPGAFTRADRAVLRFQKVLTVSDSSTDLLWYMSSHGLLGDYMVQAILFAAGGKFATICAQLALLLLSAAATFRLCEAIGLSRRASGAGMAFFLLLPHSIAFPHQLTTEAIYLPLLVLSTWLAVLGARRGSLAWLALAGVLLGVATLVRPVTLLWPVVVGTVLAVLWRPSKGIQFAAAAFFPILLWMSFLWQTAGDFGLGESQASMGRLLYQRVRLISSTLPADARAEVEASYLDQDDERGRLGVGDYLSFGLQHPVPFVVHFGRDSLVFWLKSGVEKVTIDYLGGGASFTDLKQDDGGGWRHRLQRDGPIATGVFLWQQLGIVLVISAIGAVFMVAWLLFAVLGGARLLRQASRLPREQLLTVLLLTLLPIYVFGVSQVIDVPQSRHRAPAEFALVVLGTYGASVFWKWLKARRARAYEGSSLATEPAGSVHR